MRLSRMGLALAVIASLAACKKDSAPAGGGGGGGAAKPQKELVVGLVTDVGGRGDQSFNDSALRGLESWAAGLKFVGGAYQPLAPAERLATVPKELGGQIVSLAVKPVVVQSKAQEDYQPNLQLLVDQGASLVVGTGFMLENAVETVAKQNAQARFLLIDSPLLDAKGQPVTLPNVRTVVFREEEGSFLVGALAGLVAKEKVGFVGGMEIPLIRKFEAGFRAGVHTTNPKATVLVQYTGSFDNVAKGKQAGQDLVDKGAEVVFQAAGSDGLGAIQAVKEAHAQGKSVLAIGVDSDQSHLAPEAMLTSMVKRVDFAVWQSAKAMADGTWAPGDVVMGLKEGGVGMAEVRIDFPGKADALAKVEALRQQLVAGTLKAPSNAGELATFLK